MSLPFTWLPDVLRAAGLDVMLYPGWETRTAGTRVKDTWGVLCHHDAAPPSARRKWITPRMIAEGHSTLPGPISQLLITDDCHVHVIAAGSANHAGKGRIPGTLYTDGNARLIGIEINNDGVGELWAAPLLETYLTTVAAILTHLGLGSERAIGHKEYAPARKIDPAGPWDQSWRGGAGGSWAQMGRWRELVGQRQVELAREVNGESQIAEDDMQPILLNDGGKGLLPFLELVPNPDGTVSIVGHNGARVDPSSVWLRSDPPGKVSAAHATAFGRDIVTFKVTGKPVGWARSFDGAVVVCTDRSLTYTVAVP